MATIETKTTTLCKFWSKKFSTYYSLLKTDSKTATQDDKQQDSIDEVIEAIIKGFFATESLNAETKEDKSLKLVELEEVKIPISCKLCKKFFAAPSYSLYS